MAAYEGGYGGQQHQYGGPALRQYGNAPPQQYGAPQQYDNQNGYGYDDYNGGYGQDPNYPRGPPQDPYGRGGRPMPGGRGGPIPRPQTADPHRGRGPPPRGRGMPNGVAGRGGMRPGPYNAHSDPAGNYPPFPAQGREQQMVDQMAGMDLNGGRASFDHQRPPVSGGRGPPPRGHPQGRGPPGGFNEYDDGYGSGGPRGGFGPPARSMTMPVEDPGARNHMPPPPQRMGTMPIKGPAGQGMGMPQRPSTAAGHRPPPQRRYPDEPQSATTAQYAGGYDDVYDAYFDNNRNSNQDYGANQQQNRTSLPDFDVAPPQSGRDSFEQTMRPAQEQHQGAHQMTQLNHAKSQPNLRQPQTAVFEMANDAPPMPSMNGFQQGYDQGYSGQGGYDRPPMSSTPTPMRQGGPQYPNGDNLPSHPTPVRPGLMANSVVNLNNKPPPVRNYGAAPTPTPQQQMQPPPQPQHHQPPPQQQQPPPQQLRQPNPPQNPARDEPPVTMQELEHLRMVIKSNPSDQNSALKLAKRLLEATDVLAPKLPDPKQRARARERYLIDCQKILKKLSNAQNQEAMFIHADCLGKGLFSHEPDFKEAFTLYQSAAKLGHPAAAYRTAVCCEIGHEDGGGTRKDPLKAIQWYKRAATLGDPPAMYKVGMILLKGLLGQPKNVREAVGWLKRAAERADTENPHALHELGLLYESAQSNNVIIRDEQYALNLFIQAAELGYKFSQYRLGCSYEYGLMGCPIDPRHSIMWYSKAATQGEHQSELALSGWYLTGSDGVLNQSDTEAYLWARKAAMAGLAKAEYAMGYFTEVGIGVPANLEDAKRWYWRAAAQEFPKARERLEDLKRSGKSGQRQRERISRSKIERQQDGDCTIM